jgi:hypothetical protein
MSRFTNQNGGNPAVPTNPLFGQSASAGGATSGDLALVASNQVSYNDCMALIGGIEVGNPNNGISQDDAQMMLLQIQVPFTPASVVRYQSTATYVFWRSVIDFTATLAAQQQMIQQLGFR